MVNNQETTQLKLLERLAKSRLISAAATDSIASLRSVTSGTLIAEMMPCIAVGCASFLHSSECRGEILHATNYVAKLGALMTYYYWPSLCA